MVASLTAFDLPPVRGARSYDRKRYGSPVTRDASRLLAKTPGVVLWHGPSPVNGSPVVCIATLQSGNEKTGNAVQVWILGTDAAVAEPDGPTHNHMRDTAASMLASARTGDAAMRAQCGDCPHAGDACYLVKQIRMLKGPVGVLAAYQRGRYPVAGADVPWSVVADALDGRFVRLGAYGDPGMLPVWLVAMLATSAPRHTGYTHQWRTCDPQLSRWVMASVDTDREARLAQALGWRTFRPRSSPVKLPRQLDKLRERLADPAVRRAVRSELDAGEVQCPAAKEAGYRRTCAECGLCSGTDGRGTVNVSIVLH